MRLKQCTIHQPNRVTGTFRVEFTNFQIFQICLLTFRSLVFFQLENCKISVLVYFICTHDVKHSKKMQKEQKNTHRVCSGSIIALAIQLIFARVVSTILSGILFARFHTVNPISKRSVFYLLRHRWSKKFHSRKKVHFSHFFL